MFWMILFGDFWAELEKSPTIQINQVVTSFRSVFRINKILNLHKTNWDLF